MLYSQLTSILSSFNDDCQSLIYKYYTQDGMFFIIWREIKSIYQNWMGKNNKKKQQREEQSHEETYEVESIVDKKVIGGKNMFLVKWLNYDEKYNSWQPEENFSNIELLREYQIKLQQSKGLRNCPIMESSSFKNHSEYIFEEQESCSEGAKSSKSQSPAKLPQKRITRFEAQQKTEKKQNPKNLNQGEEESQRQQSSQSSQNLDQFQIDSPCSISQEQMRKQIERKEDNSSISEKMAMKQKSILKIEKKSRKALINKPIGVDPRQLDFSRNIKQQSNPGEIEKIDLDKKQYELTIQYERIIGKEIIFEFTKGKERYFRLKLSNNQIITLRDDKMRLYFPQLLIDHYRKILSQFVKQG